MIKLKLLLMSFFLLYAKFVISVPTPNQRQWDLRAIQSINGVTYYGDNFTSAWQMIDQLGIKPGEGVNVAVIDTGYTDHPGLDGQLLTSGQPGQYGISFVVDCRFSGYCNSNTREAEARGRMQELHGAQDVGDFVSTTEKTDPNTVFYNWNYCSETSSWHGTNMMGLIAGTGKNIGNVLGGAYGVKILPIRVQGKCNALGLTPHGQHVGYEPEIRWAAGLEPTNEFYRDKFPKNTHNVDIISISVGMKGKCPLEVENAIRDAINKGKIVVASTNNDSLPSEYSYPANCREVISVAAKNGLKKLASYSGFGEGITISASSGDDSLCDNTDCRVLAYISKSRQRYNPAERFIARYNVGASISTAHLSAAIANIISVLKKRGEWNPSNPNNQNIIKDILINSADKFATGGNCNQDGKTKCVPDRVLNVGKAVEYAQKRLQGYLFIGLEKAKDNNRILRCTIRDGKLELNSCIKNIPYIEATKINYMSSSPDGKFLLIGSDKGLHVCSVTPNSISESCILYASIKNIIHISEPKRFLATDEYLALTSDGEFHGGKYIKLVFVHRGSQYILNNTFENSQNIPLWQMSYIGFNPISPQWNKGYSIIAVGRHKRHINSTRQIFLCKPNNRDYGACKDITGGDPYKIYPYLISGHDQMFIHATNPYWRDNSYTIYSEQAIDPWYMGYSAKISNGVGFGRDIKRFNNSVLLINAKYVPLIAATFGELYSYPDVGSYRPVKPLETLETPILNRHENGMYPNTIQPVIFDK